MRNVLLCAALAAVLLPSAARAQSQPLTEAEALARLSMASPRVRAIKATVGIALADVAAAGRWPNPRLSFDRESVVGTTETMTTVTQLLPVTGRRGLEIEAASAAADAVSHRADEAVRRARTDLRIAFAQLRAAQIREREFTASLERLRDLSGVLARREAAGDAAGFDRLRAERELVDVETDLAAARVDRARAQAALASFFVDVTDPTTIVASDAPSASFPALPDVAALIERAESSRGDLLALLKDVEAARLSEHAAERRRVPEPEIVAGTKRSNLSGGDTGGVFAIQATLPLFDRNGADRAAAQARAQLAAAQADALRLTLRVEIVALRATVAARRATADDYRTRAVSGVSALERIAQVSYEAGERSILELLDAYRVGGAARIRQAELDAAVRQAEVELEYVSGWEMP